ncbi:MULTISPECIES: vWA domain-containing protein [Vibrio]|uniref:VWFA domain-containing protein n=2 Tax=Vibrio TaxID=662 RepID=A0A7X4RWL2_9VIBR|nr:MULTISPECIES: pilus assembly protein TadG-related protein [Vibrio]MBF9002234.1 hypothetical protein [Vibrio nitrifigilis]MZI96021.1 hypothetical protein [Vibrio eleionomae]
MAMQLKNKQHGHAAMLFAMLIPLLFGVFILGTDGARALQDKARLEEAAEMAALAIAGQSGSTDDAHDEMASNYIQYYFPYAEVTDIETHDIACEDNTDCDPSASASERFFEYTVAAKISQPNWFSSDTIETSFGDNLTVGGYSSARKYQSKTVDIVLVSDFSSSMFNSVTSARDAKYIELKDIISEVSETLEEYNEKTNTNKNTLSFVGFNSYVYGPSSISGTKTATTSSTTKTKSYSGYPYYSYLVCKSDEINKYGNPHPKEDGWCTNSYDDIDFSSTVSHIFSSDDYFLPTSTQSSQNVFYTLDLTSDFESFNNTISGFEPDGTTAFYSGLIRGAQIANQGSNPRRLIIILSDGMNTHTDITDTLIANDLCSTITDHLNSLKTVSGDTVKSRLFAIGFGYKVSSYPQMGECVGDDNVYDATDSDSIKDKILELIAEEMGRLSPVN